MQIAELIAQLHIIHAKEDEYLFISASQIKNAGNGLFTIVPIYTAEIISVFTGKQLSLKEASFISSKGEDMYFINLPDGSTLDCMYANCFAKYANDAEGMRVSKFKNNAVILEDEEGKICLVATRKIKAGEEIFCSYGKPYWNNIASKQTV